MHTIAIIGAGFSGAMVAAHLLRSQPTAALNIILIERSGQFTAGVAYGTRSAAHLLNVPAGRMSAYESDPDHFLRWARRRDPAVTGGTFVARALYREYLASTLDDAEDHAGPLVQLSRVPGEARAIMRGKGGARLSIELSGGGLVHADLAALAIGNFPPANPPAANGEAMYASPAYARDPWAPDALNVAPDETVMLLGTGLTMLDIALALRERGHVGPIYALSRRGLMPQAHRHSSVAPPHHRRPASLDSWTRTASGLLRALRDEVERAAERGIDWREVVTSIRHDTPGLWMSLPAREKERFLRHLRPFWETHRHRSAPATAAKIERMIEAGQLRVLAARLAGYGGATRDGVDVRIRCRRAAGVETIRVARVINCTGPDTDLSRVSEPLIVSLREAGLIRPDALGLGLDADERGALLSAGGAPSDRLFLVGPLRKGRLWENTAVPELRIEAEAMARRLIEALPDAGAQSRLAG